MGVKVLAPILGESTGGRWNILLDVFRISTGHVGELLRHDEVVGVS